MVEDGTIEFEMLLGRNFFLTSKIKMTYQNGEFVFEYPPCEEMALDFIYAIELESESEQYENISMDEELDYKTRRRVSNLLREVDGVQIKPVKDDHKIRVHVKDASFFRYAPRRMSMMEKRELMEITDDLLKRDIIKPSISPYCLRVVLVPKHDGTKRMCVDLRPLNQKIFPQKYPFPLIEDQIDQLNGKRYYTKLDFRDGYHQIDIHPDDTKFFAFATPYGQFEYVKMPFGYSEAGAEFQKQLIYVFRELLRQNKIILYIDDILVATKTIDENLSILREVLIILKKYGLKLNLAKCSFIKREIEFLGYLVSDGGITINKRHTKAISDFEYPKNLKQLQGFLGLTNYFRRFIKDYAPKAKPLHELTKKDIAFVFGEGQKQAFDLLKREMISYPVLRIYNPAAETELHTDASNQGFGAILLQKQESGNMGPIAYFSKATNDTEKKYHSFELETLAIAKALERFHVYLHGIPFRIVTDCNALALAMKKININPRIARTLAFQDYRFELVHRAAEKMNHVDFLNRNVVTINAITAEDEVMYKQLTDPKLRKIADRVELKVINDFY